MTPTLDRLRCQGVYGAAPKFSHFMHWRALLAAVQLSSDELVVVALVGCCTRGLLRPPPISQHPHARGAQPATINVAPIWPFEQFFKGLHKSRLPYARWLAPSRGG